MTWQMVVRSLLLASAAGIAYAGPVSMIDASSGCNTAGSGIGGIGTYNVSAEAVAQYYVPPSVAGNCQVNIVEDLIVMNTIGPGYLSINLIGSGENTTASFSLVGPGLNYFRSCGEAGCASPGPIAFTTGSPFELTITANASAYPNGFGSASSIVASISAYTIVNMPQFCPSGVPSCPTQVSQTIDQASAISGSSASGAPEPGTVWLAFGAVAFGVRRRFLAMNRRTARFDS